MCQTIFAYHTTNRLFVEPPLAQPARNLDGRHFPPRPVQYIKGRAGQRPLIRQIAQQVLNRRRIDSLFRQFSLNPLPSHRPAGESASDPALRVSSIVQVAELGQPTDDLFNLSPGNPFPVEQVTNLEAGSITGGEIAYGKL
ncbi:MAG: hypothetical protein NNA19_07940 [Nitrospira sp.]|nr:hypothetical protein [Nitrospira sp.]